MTLRGSFALAATLAGFLSAALVFAVAWIAADFSSTASISRNAAAIGLAAASAALLLAGILSTAIWSAYSRRENERKEAELEARRRLAAKTEELKRAKESEALYSTACQNAQEGMVFANIEGKILEANEALSRMSGYTRDELVGADSALLKSDLHDGEFYESMKRSVLEKGAWEGEVWSRKKDGTDLPEWLSISTVRDEKGRAASYVGISSDLSRIKKAEEKNERLASFDPLTGLPNRALFRDRLEHALARARRTSDRIAVLSIDLDRFKTVNETLGHTAGDELLVQAAGRISNEVRDADTVSHLGGDEFGLVLDGISRTEDAGELARRIVGIMSKPFSLAGTEASVGASVGVAVFPYDGTNADDLVKNADAAMYRAKEAGRGQYRYASGDIDTESRKRLEIEAKLARALERDELLLYYQPQTSAGGTARKSCSGLVGAEALMRWAPGGGKILGPGAFIEVAEETGLIVAFGEWAIRTACKEAVLWRDSGHPLVVSVNVSPRQFAGGKLFSVVSTALEDTGLEPSLLKLEVTEGLFMRDFDRTIELMLRIKAMGVTFAVDDFGIGYSSLRYINKLPINCLKIDKAFIDGVHDPLDGGEIVTAAISLARAFGFISIAEGVETEDQLAALKMRGCDEIQGYLVSEPLNAESFRGFMKSG